MINTVIFDLDGTLVQTEKLKALSYAKAAVELCPVSITTDEVIDEFAEVVGRSRREVAEYLVEKFDLQEKAAARMKEFSVSAPWQAFVQVRLQHYNALLADSNVILENQWPHNIALLQAARKACKNVALATMSHCEQTSRVLSILGLDKSFDFIATRDDVEYGKPNPEIYELVAKDLGVSAENCLVIEDSPSGTQAALNANMHVLAVATPFTRNHLYNLTTLDPQFIIDTPADIIPRAAELISQHNTKSLDDSSQQPATNLQQPLRRSNTMEIAMVGLGKMGANMTKRLLRDGHRVIVTDLNADAIAEAEAEGAVGAASLEELVGKFEISPRAVWVMVPAGKPTEFVTGKLAELLDDGDILIDGGNSNYKNTIRRSEMLRENGVEMIDCGTSGGVWGLAEGYSMMVGGKDEAVAHVRPAFETLAPAADKGWGHVGPNGAGHYTKMVHNGIEYGMMQAYAEGFEILQRQTGVRSRPASDCSKIWQHGSVVRSWLLDLTANALSDDPKLSDIDGYVPDSGEGRWTVIDSIELNVPAPVITLALQMRFASRDDTQYWARLLAAMRNQFGGHAIKKLEDSD